MIQSFKKTMIRYLVREQLNKMDFSVINEKSKKIFNKLKDLKEFKKANSIFIYISLKDEVQTFELIDYLLKEWKKVIVPKVVWNSLEVVKLKHNQKLVHWKYWILEPRENDLYKWKIDVAIIPWLAFSLTWKRVWKWWWYYDQFLSKNINTYKIWICFWVQVLEEDKIPVEKHDVPMDKVIYD